MTKQAKKPLQVLFAAFEAAPFSKTGGLGDVAGSLPGYIATKTVDIRVVLPKLSSIPQQYQDKMEFMTAFEVPLSWRHQYCGLFKLRHKGVTYYFLDNEYYFKRGKIYGEMDDGERVAFFSKALLECIAYIPDFMPDVLHCNDWHTALAPVFLREHYNHLAGYNRIKTVFTIHNLKFQGVFPADMLDNVLGLNDSPAAHQLMYKDVINLMQGACRYCDRITTVSPTYADEICTGYYGEKLDWLFNQRRDILSGILNGIDYKKFDPMTDPAISIPFNADSLEKKRENKMLLQKDLGLEVDADIPMFTVISRLTEQKGLDLITYNLGKIIDRKMQLVVLGIGDKVYEDTFSWYAHQYPDKVSACLVFDEALSHRIYACADVLLMPSRFEPCGLAQMMAMRYACLPLVRETGGLKDSVACYNKFTGEGTGFSFANFNAHEFMDTVDTALYVWYNVPEDWEQLQKAAMTADFSWRASAKEYRSLYKELTKG